MLPKIKKLYSLPKKSAKRIEQEKQFVKDDDILWKWFEERRKELTGKCKHCGGKTCKDDDEKFHFSIAHILPKAYFPSVATHPLNFVELCFWSNACHTQMDNKMLDMTDMNCWDEIVERFIAMYPAIDKKERRRIPETLLHYINIDI